MLQSVAPEQQLAVQQALQSLRTSTGSVNKVASAAALQRVNNANAATMQQHGANGRYCSPAQQHHGSGASLHMVTFLSLQ